MKRLRKSFLVMLIASTLIAMGAVQLAATNTDEVQAYWEVTGCWFSLTATPPTIQVGESAGGSDIQKDNATHIHVLNNCNEWKVQIKENDGDIDYSGTYPNPQKPVSDFKFRKHGGSWRALSDSYQDVDSGSGYVVTFSMDYKVDVKPSDVPGTYTAKVDYLATTP